MSASDAAPLPRLGEVFFDVRGSSRSMRLSWYADTGVAVFSIWQGGVCTGTFRLPIGDLGRMIEILQRGPVGHHDDDHGGAGYDESAYDRDYGAESAGDHDGDPDYGAGEYGPGEYGHSGHGDYRPAPQGRPDYGTSERGASRHGTGEYGGAGEYLAAGEYGVTGEYGPGEYAPGEYEPAKYRPGEYGARENGPGEQGRPAYRADDYAAGDYGAGAYGAGEHGAGEHGAGEHGAGEYGAGAPYRPVDYDDAAYGAPGRRDNGYSDVGDRADGYPHGGPGLAEYEQAARTPRPGRWHGGDVRYQADVTGQRSVAADETGYGQQRFVPPYVREQRDSSQARYLDDSEYRLPADPGAGTRHSAGRHSSGQQ
jgi:hypothetical protein